MVDLPIPLRPMMACISPVRIVQVDALEDRCALHLNMQILDLQQRGVAHGSTHPPDPYQRSYRGTGVHPSGIGVISRSR